MTGFGDLSPKFPLVLAMLIFMSSLNFMLNKIENDISFIMSSPAYLILMIKGLVN